MATFVLNGISTQLEVTADTPLLWALRETAGLTGTKFGCGIGACGACTVHVNGVATRSCITQVAAVEGASITTIEGLATDAGLHPVQQAWIQHQVPQCGYCQSGMIMAVSALLSSNAAPDDATINAAITNICRCATYERIRTAIHSLAAVSIEEPSATPPAPVTEGRTNG